MGMLGTLPWVGAAVGGVGAAAVGLITYFCHRD